MYIARRGSCEHPRCVETPVSLEREPEEPGGSRGFDRLFDCPGGEVGRERSCTEATAFAVVRGDSLVTTLRDQLVRTAQMEGLHTEEVREPITNTNDRGGRGTEDLWIDRKVLIPHAFVGRRDHEWCLSRFL